MKKTKGFTLVEILMVLVITGILLGIVLNLSWSYLKRLSYQQDREKYISVIDEIIMRGRTTNYYKETKYSYFDIVLDNSEVNIFYGTGDASEASSCGSGVAIRNIVFEKSEFSGLGSIGLPYTIRIEPYKLGCKDYCSVASVSTGVLVSKSIYSDDKACFSFDGNLCKFSQTSCP